MLLVIEIIFGNWFLKNNINRLHIIKDKELIIDIGEYYEFKTNYIKYKRDSYGLRGSYPNINSINILTVGGSTTDQRLISEGHTYQDILQKKFKSINKNVYIANAGIDGQSTYGHIKNFELWFPLIPNLNPDYFLFFIGINDFYIDNELDYDELNIETKNLNIIDSLLFYYRRDSALHYFFNTINGILISNNFNLGHQKLPKDTFNNINWTKESIQNNYEFLNESLKSYRLRLNELIEKVEELGSKIIFVSQSEKRKYFFKDKIIYGNSEKVRVNNFYINGVDYYNMSRLYINVIKEISEEKNIIFYDLDKELKFDIKNDFYDNAHFNHLGAEKIGDYLFTKLIHLY